MPSIVALRCSVGDLAVSSGSLQLPQSGAWSALLECGSASAPTGAATIVIRREDGTEDLFVGTVRRADVTPGSETMIATVIAGADGLRSELPPRPYAPGSTPVPAGLVARGIADDAGETLADGVETALDGRALPRWHRAAGTRGAVALDLLAEDLGYSWRFLADGTLWIGEESWPALNSRAFWAGAEPNDGWTRYATDGAPFLPGQAIDSARAVEVIYELAPLRARVRHSVTGAASDLADRTVYRASYAATVVAQRADGTLDLVADDPTMGEILAVPFRLGIPGAAATIPEGSRVRVAFESASPAGAYAIAIDSDPEANKALSLVGDSCGYLSGTAPPGGGPVVFTLSSTATGNPGEVQITIRGPGHKYAMGASGP